MGMAASQARYLELTARKTNVEFQGQQINQQRTELANESAGLFGQLMGLKVPTAPSSTNFTTTNYSFNNGAYNCTIAENGIQPLVPTEANYNSLVTYSYTTTPYTGVDQVRTDLTASNVGGVYWLSNARLKAYDPTNTTDLAAVTQIKVNLPTSPVATALPSQIYQYNAGTTTYYVSQIQLDAMIAAGGTGTIDTEYAANINKTNTVTEKAWVDQAKSGRYSSIQLASTGATTFNLNTTTTTDQNAYNDAVNEYTYQQQAYEQQVTNINAKTSIVQNEDKTLELMLKQLDTEQQALSTEMDSVKKVIDKNIEQTYKTFSS